MQLKQFLSISHLLTVRCGFACVNALSAFDESLGLSPKWTIFKFGRHSFKVPNDLKHSSDSSVMLCV